MVSYLFANNKNNVNVLIEKITSFYNLDIIDNVSGNIVLGNSDMLIDIGLKYVSILLYNDKINIKPIKDDLMESYHE